MVEPESVVRDDLLRLIFTCAHPALAIEAQVALALRTLGGLDVAAIARGFLVTEATMAKRLVRARQKTAHAQIPDRVPSDAELPDRLPGVLAVVHLIATEAHAPSRGGDLVRVDLEHEAQRLARLLAELMLDEPEVLSLLALLLLDVAVRRSSGVAGPYQLQAHLAACHSTAPSWLQTDWDRIGALYDLLAQRSPNPVVALNRAVTRLERDGPATGLAALGRLGERQQAQQEFGSPSHAPPPRRNGDCSSAR